MLPSTYTNVGKTTLTLCVTNCIHNLFYPKIKIISHFVINFFVLDILLKFELASIWFWATKKNILFHLKIYLRPCFWNNFYYFKNFTEPFLVFENEQFLNLVKFCDVNNWKLCKIYIWASPIFQVFISLNHWLRKILLDIKFFWFSKIKRGSVKFLKE